jgi:pimeloyl-ACP methyl ester carboxylesterase
MKRATHGLQAALLLLLLAGPVIAGERWQSLPPTPAAIPPAQSGRVLANGASLYYAQYGQGSPVILLHGGLANANYWGWQIDALASSHTVIALDSRGHGRSTLGTRRLSYGQMAQDVIALMERLGLGKTAIVGWSDGAVVGLDLAMRYPERVSKVVAFAANTDPSGLLGGAGRQPAFAAYVRRAPQEYAALSPAPGDYAGFVRQLKTMWGSEPNWTAGTLKTIALPVLVIGADHDEVIKRAHAEYIAATIPGAKLVMLEAVSHFAFLQDPGAFNRAVLGFLDGGE